MRVKIVLMLILVFALTGGGMAMAHEGDHKASSASNSSNTMEGMDMSGKDKNMDMSNMDMSGQKDVKTSKKSDDMEGMNMGEEPIKETPPNVKVLGTYGAVNGAFIIIGVWNKWFRRKDGSDGNTK